MAGNSAEAGRSVTNKITSILMTFTEGSEHTLTEIAQLAGRFPDTRFRLRCGTRLWLGDRLALRAAATVQQSIPVSRGDRLGELNRADVGKGQRSR